MYFKNGVSRRVHHFDGNLSRLQGTCLIAEVRVLREYDLLYQLGHLLRLLRNLDLRVKFIVPEIDEELLGDLVPATADVFRLEACLWRNDGLGMGVDWSGLY